MLYPCSALPMLGAWSRDATPKLVESCRGLRLRVVDGAQCILAERSRSSARIFSPTHPPGFLWDRERIGAGGKQHGNNGAVLASAWGMGRGRHLPAPSPALPTNYTNSTATAPSAEAKGPAEA